MSLIYMTTTTPVDVAAGGQIPFSVTRRTGCAIQNGDNSIILKKPGYYSINATVTFAADAVGDVTVELQKNNVAIPGMTASVTAVTPDTDLYTLNITGILRVFCYEGDNILTLVNNSSVALTVSNVSIQVID